MDIHGNLVDIHEGRIYPAAVSIEGKTITRISPNGYRGRGFLIPGFVDSHLHLESSLLPPSEFAKIAIRHGTLGAVCDPSGFAHLFGISGIEYLIDNALRTPLKFAFTAPSCVPFDPKVVSGDFIDLKQIEELLKNELIVALGEVKNLAAFQRQDPELMAKIRASIMAEKPVDGHGLGWLTEDLQKALQARISTDHESTSLSEARQKRALGMYIAIQEGSAARHLGTLFPLLEEDPQGCFFCSHHLTPDHLLLGHIQLIVKKAVQRGLDPIEALRCASKNPIEHYGLNIGLLRVDDPADFLIVEDLRNFRVMEAYINGECVFKDTPFIPPVEAAPLHKWGATKIGPEQLIVEAKPGRIHVIELTTPYGLTKKGTLLPSEKNGELISDPSRDLLKIVAVDRVASSPPVIGFIKNFGLKHGAIASSIAHDSHPLIAIGTNDSDLCKVLNGLIDSQGGLALSHNDTLHLLPLPLGGLLSNLPGEELIRHYRDLLEKAKELAPLLDNPFLTLSMLADPALPEIKITDRGLIDTARLEPISLYI